MSKGNRKIWFRGARTIAASFFKKHGQMGAQAPGSTFLMSIGFVVVLSAMVLSWFWWWFPYHLFSDEVYDVVVVNAPQSFIDYNQYMQKYRDMKAADYGSRTDWLSNWGHMSFFDYNYDGYGWTKFIYKENPALWPPIGLPDGRAGGNSATERPFCFLRQSSTSAQHPCRPPPDKTQPKG